MKTESLLKLSLSAGLVLAVLQPGQLRAANEAAEQHGIMPTQKVPLLVTEQERNPFAARDSSKDVDLFNQLSSESQESRIRKVFSALKVSGVSKAGGGNYRVLIGDMDLRQGEEVPPVIIGQTERLVVSSISEEVVMLSWVDTETKQTDGRKLAIPIGMHPAVEFELKGHTGENGKIRAMRVFDSSGKETLKLPGEIKTAQTYDPVENPIEAGRDE